MQELRRCLGRHRVPRLEDLGRLAPLGGVLDERLDRVDSPEYRLVAVFGEPG